MTMMEGEEEVHENGERRSSSKKAAEYIPGTRPEANVEAKTSIKNRQLIFLNLFSSDLSVPLVLVK